METCQISLVLIHLCLPVCLNGPSVPLPGSDSSCLLAQMVLTLVTQEPMCIIVGIVFLEKKGLLCKWVKPWDDSELGQCMVGDVSQLLTCLENVLCQSQVARPHLHTSDSADLGWELLLDKDRSEQLRCRGIHDRSHVLCSISPPLAKMRPSGERGSFLHSFAFRTSAGWRDRQREP